MRTILVVEDEISIIEFLKDALEDKGYRVETASNGQEGLQRLNNAPIDLILCDVMMPVMDGREMCRVVQSDPQFAHIPLILMSAVVSVLSDISCSLSGFIQKPFNVNDLLMVIDELTQAKGAT